MDMLILPHFLVPDPSEVKRYRTEGQALRWIPRHWSSFRFTMEGEI